MSQLQDEWFLSPDVEVVDGGTWGLNLVPVLDHASHVIVFDAVSIGQAPGTMVELRSGQIPRYLERQKLSPHQVDLRDVLALCELRETSPGELVVLGVQPERVELGASLSPCVEAQVPSMVRAAASQLRAWGKVCFRHQVAHA
jgi:hydrogenase maturation protease